MDPGPASSRPRELAQVTRSLGGLRVHGPSLLLFLVFAGISGAVFVFLQARARSRQQAAFNAQATPIVANLRAGFELPLEVLRASAALFEASGDVTRAEFARFVKPALERHPGIRALEWIPIVPGAERARFEEAARADGLVGFAFRERVAGTAAMQPASPRAEHFPIFYMEPGHPLVLGFDCTSEPERRACAARARAQGSAVATQRITLIDDQPSVYSIAVFQPVFDPARPRGPAAVRGFTAQVFRVRAIVEQAIADSLRLGVQVLLLDTDAPPERRLLFESQPDLEAHPPPGPRYETMLRFADRSWQIAISGAPAATPGWTWLVLGLGLGASALGAFGLSAARLVFRLRGQVRAHQQLGQYTLLDRLGEGGAGVVYRARHAMLRRPTAIKLMSGGPPDRMRLARFEREVQLTSELTHPNTIAIYDYGRTPEGVFYYAMELIDGVTLQDLLDREGPLPAARVCHFLRQAGQAIAEAHGIGLVHRDLKPSNLMVCRRGGIPDFLKVMDFGLVKDVGSSRDREPGASPALTQSTVATVLGTPLYLAPEAISRPQDVDGRVDIYALGAVAYTLLVAAPVFTGQTVVEVCAQHLQSPPRPPSERTTQPIPASLERIILRCLAKQPGDRYASVADLLAALADAPDITAWTDEQAERWWRTRGDLLVAEVRAARARPV